jgi:hypothetical protein
MPDVPGYVIFCHLRRVSFTLPRMGWSKLNRLYPVQSGKWVGLDRRPAEI